MRSLICILATVLTAPVAAQGITIAEGDPTARTVRVLDETNPSAPGVILLQNTEFVDIEISARTVLQSLDTSRPRRVSADGLWRIEMPGSARLLQYRRDGGAYHGFLWIPSSGLASVVLERTGTGPSGLQSPFADRIAVAPDGLHAAVPLVASGLEILCLEERSRVATPLHEVRSAAPPDGTAEAPQVPVPPPDTGGGFVATHSPVLPTSVMVGTQVFYLTTDDHLWRVPLHAGRQPEDVSPPPVTDAELKDEMALSGDGSTLVFLYGPKDEQQLWVVHGSGPANVLPAPPSDYEEPGYLPEGEGQPRLFLNDDGTSLLYSDHSVDDEIFLLDLTAPAPHHLTSDANFEPYIGVGILPFFRASTLLMAIGDEAQMDWFLADATPGNVVNLTLTGPDPRPFSPGLLDPLNAVLTPETLFVTERVASGGLCLRGMSPDEPPGEILYDDLQGDLVPGSHFSGSADFLVMTSAGDRLLDGAGTTLVGAPPGVSLSAPARGPRDALRMFRAMTDTGLGAAIFHLRDGTLVSTPPVPGLEQAVFTSNGGALLNAEVMYYLAPGEFEVIPTTGDAVVLSGAGA